MAETETPKPKDPKTETIGSLSLDKVSRLKSWKAYETARDAFSRAKKAAEEAKDTVRTELSRTRNLELDGLDFYQSTDGIVLFKSLKPTGTRRRTIKELD
jgi:hypothetical protein